MQHSLAKCRLANGKAPGKKKPGRSNILNDGCSWGMDLQPTANAGVHSFEKCEARHRGEGASVEAT